MWQGETMTQKEREKAKYAALWTAFQQQLVSERVLSSVGTASERIRTREAKALLRKVKVICANHRRRAQKAKSPLIVFTPQDWEAILLRYAYKCAYCRLEKIPLTQDHVIPLSKGGYHHRSNIIPACRSCNSRKGNRPAQRYNPLIIPW